MMSFERHDEALALFLSQHAMLHSAEMAGTDSWSFEDALLNDMTAEQVRHIPSNCDHSVAWLIWHIARIEDVAMNLLVAGQPQVLRSGSWQKQLGIAAGNTGNKMSTEEVMDVSAKIDIARLRAYRIAVGRSTREIVRELEPGNLKQKVDASRLELVMKEGALVEEARGIRDYWSRRNIAGLLLMPATRHNLVHLNEALRVKRKGSGD